MPLRAGIRVSRKTRQRCVAQSELSHQPMREGDVVLERDDGVVAGIEIKAAASGTADAMR